jgi:iron complex transport system ATP-binding protein
VIALDSATVALGGRTIVHAVTLQVPAGGWTMLIGPNGAGKTTLLRAVAGALPHGGTVTVGGEDPARLTARRRAQRLAVVRQSPLMPLDMTVREYVLLGRTAYLGMLGRPGARDRRATDEALARLDLCDLAARRLGALSGGERQRTALARCLAQEAPVLLLDEPTTALDIGRQQEVLELVGELRAERDLTVLGAMHDLTLAGQYADRLVLLDAGHAVAHGDPGEVLTEELVRRHYRATVAVLDVGGDAVVVPRRLYHPPEEDAMSAQEGAGA